MTRSTKLLRTTNKIPFSSCSSIYTCKCVSNVRVYNYMHFGIIKKQILGLSLSIYTIYLICHLSNCNKIIIILYY